ncbi:hypothetical protein DKX38_029978 [Salix brachista]|uniref:Wound-induced protein 1 n=1 Tax=Salix brachista TaxID=2182728 RepID=A0A5N5J412_9ROSI|nr:hypothetical protein DKX38_029978 [Salix brachista]
MVLVEGFNKDWNVSWVHAWTVTNGIITQVKEYFNTSVTVTRFGDGGSIASSPGKADSSEKGDNSTLFFHITASRRGAQGFISQVIHNEIFCDNPRAIKDAEVEFYSERPISMEELKEAIWECDKAKARVRWV